jgi:hypothetical protein
MSLRAWVALCAVGTACSLAACGNNNNQSTTGSGSSTGVNGTGTTTGATTTGGSTTGPGLTTTGSSTSGTSTSGSSGTATTSGSSSTTGATTGQSTTSGSGTTTSGTSSTGGTTGYVATPPYMGFDGGPLAEPPVAPGCTPAAPFANPVPGSYPYCVSCRRNSDCPTGLLCDTNVDATNFYKSYQCVVCRTSTDCTGGEVCQFACSYIQRSPYYVCENGCQQDCRDAGADFCNPGLCDTDAGGCLANWCATNANCVVNGQGACDFTRAVTFPPNGIGQCAACTTDAGGCGVDQVCNPSSRSCQLSCLVDAGVCTQGTYCTDAGSCTSGCQTAADCVGSYTGYSGGSICHQGSCVSCLKSADCPDYKPGCNPYYSSGSTATCGYCVNDSDCAGLHCETNKTYSYYANQCGCHSDSECPLDAPICIGLDTDAGFPQGSGRCGCSSTNDCVQGLICEMRPPYQVSVRTLGTTYTGGACIPQCNLVGGTDCSTAGIASTTGGKGYPSGSSGAYACNPTTGYCVSCSGDGDCYTYTNAPSIAPSCVLYPNGVDPTSGEATGGGQCGCSDTSQCNDNYACWNPGLSGTCQPACTVVNGQDSCNPYREYAYYTPPANPFCNTWTGACVQCLDAYGCTNVTVNYINGSYTYQAFAAPNCNTGGQCVGCSSDADCPAGSPNCTDGFCGYCTNNANCYGDAGFTCVEFYSYYTNGLCALTGCVPDSNGNPTDAGFACPSGLPYCASTYKIDYTTYTYTYFDMCAACRPDGVPPNYNYYYDCNATIPPGKHGGNCGQNGTCYYY